MRKHPTTNYFLARESRFGRLLLLLQLRVVRATYRFVHLLLGFILAATLQTTLPSMTTLPIRMATVYCAVLWIVI